MTRRAPGGLHLPSLLGGLVLALFIGGVTLPFLVGDEGGGTPVRAGASAGAVDSTEGASPSSPTPTTGGSTVDASSPTPGAGVAPVPGATTPSTGSTSGDSTGTAGSGTPTPSGDASTTPSDNGATAATPTPAAPATLSATDRGVTAETVNVVLLIPDLGGLGDAGFAVNLGDQRASFEALVADVNADGGIAGRTLTAEYITYDPLDENDQRRACIDATEDREAFAVLSIVGFYGAAILCVTEEHDTPFLSYENEAASWFARSGDRYFGMAMSKTRMVQNQASELDRLGLLDGATIGTLQFTGGSDGEAGDALNATLADLGYTVAVEARLSDDFTEAQAQIPVVVNQMQTAGVTHVVLTTNFVTSTLFVQQAENRAYFPQYFHSDMSQGATDQGTANMPESYDGAVAITASTVGEFRVGVPQPAIEADCEARIENNGGPQMSYGDPDDAEYTSTLACSLLDVFVAGARAVGPELTRDAWSQAVQNLGPFPLSGVLAGSFAPGKFTAGDDVRTVQWNFERDGEECRCWIPVDQPRRGRF